jgi:hypothetical protein
VGEKVPVAVVGAVVSWPVGELLSGIDVVVNGAGGVVDWAEAMAGADEMASASALAAKRFRICILLNSSFAPEVSGQALHHAAVPGPETERARDRIAG